MVNIDLTPEEKDILMQILDKDLSDLSMEIRDTDLLDYREILKNRKQVVIKTLEALR